VVLGCDCLSELPAQRNFLFQIFLNECLIQQLPRSAPEVGVTPLFAADTLKSDAAKIATCQKGNVHCRKEIRSDCERVPPWISDPAPFPASGSR